MVWAQKKDCHCKCPHHTETEATKKSTEGIKKDKTENFKSFEEAKIQKILEKLKISEAEKENTRKLFEQYFKEKRELLEQFKKDKNNIENLTDEQARERIKKSFEIAQKMLDMRKEYTDIFLQKFTPKEVIEIYLIEKNMLDAIRKKHQEMKNKN